MKFSVVSHTQGRIRFVSRFFLSAPKGLKNWPNKLDLIPGIEGVRINPRTRSVLLLYMDKQSLQEAKSVIARYMRTLASKSLAIPQGQKRYL